jgi:outer membrane autotransporter protein
MNLLEETTTISRRKKGQSTLLSMVCTGLPEDQTFTYNHDREEIYFELHLDDHVICTFTITYGEPYSIAISTQIVDYEGEEATFDFTSTSLQIGAFSLTTVSGLASQTFGTQIANAFSVTQSHHEDWKLDAINCTGDPAERFTYSRDPETRTVSVDIGSAKNIACVFMVSEDLTEYITTRTKRIIRNFMARRADLITANQPDLTSRLGELLAPKLSGNSSLDMNGASFNAAFQGSLRGILDGPDDNIASDLLSKHALALEQSVGDAARLDPARFDLWVKGTYSWSEQETAETQLGLLNIGVDYKLLDGLLLGLLTQIDWTEEVDKVENYEISGVGFLTGPYMVARLHDNLLLDGRVAWGQSDNQVSPFNTYEDDFDGERWLARAQLTGDFTFGAIRFEPYVGAIYFEETQKTYTDSNGYPIDEQTISLGRMTFGPKISGRHEYGEGNALEPYVKMSGIWDFDATDAVNLESGEALADEHLRGRLEVGLTGSFAGGTRLSLTGFYDGIGVDNYDTRGGSVQLNVPLQ